MLKVSKELGKTDIMVVADYIGFVLKQLSHLKLQKLLYYVQAYHLAYFERPLFDDDFEAWVHGPVSTKVYHDLKEHSLLYKELEYVAGQGESPLEILKKALTTDQLTTIDDILKEFKDLTGQELEDLTHAEYPWQEARRGYSPSQKCSAIIKKETMLTYYREKLYGKK